MKSCIHLGHPEWPITIKIIPYPLSMSIDKFLLLELIIRYRNVQTLYINLGLKSLLFKVKNRIVSNAYYSIDVSMILEFVRLLYAIEKYIQLIECIVWSIIQLFRMFECNTKDCRSYISLRSKWFSPLLLCFRQHVCMKQMVLNSFVYCWQLAFCARCFPHSIGKC